MSGALSDTATRLRLALADKVGSAGWRKAVESVPRELFLGDAVYRADKNRGDRWIPVRRAEVSVDEWFALAYADETWVTQVGGVLAEGATDVMNGHPSSSSTLPSLVVLMLEAAHISEGDKVLEIGTGTGYSTSLMCQRLGQEAITSIEYDRLIATCSVRTIPPSWMWQVRVGGTITTPMWGWMGGVAFAHLTLTEDGTASGRFLKDALYFMTARSHLPPSRPPMVSDIGEARPSRIDPSILSDETALWVAQLAVPQAQHSWREDTTFLVDVSTGSRANTRPDPAGGWMVYQHGPIKLWDEVEEAILTWQGAGRPHQSGFGLTVTRREQRVWLGEPGGPSWNLPA